MKSMTWLNLIKTKKKSKKKYCNACQYYIPYINGEVDICGYYLNEERDPIGNLALKTYGEKEHCSTCGAVLMDERKLILRRCKDINNDFKCKLYSKVNAFIRFMRKFSRKK